MSMIRANVFDSIFGRDNCSRIRGMFVSNYEFHAFMSLVKFVEPEVMTEIGINDGKTCNAVLSEMKDLKCYYGIDVPFGTKMKSEVQNKEVPRVAGKFALGDPRLKLIITPAGTIPEIPPSDFIYIDGDHTAALRDTKAALKAIRPGGCIVWHDFWFAEVAKVINGLNEFGGHRIALIESTQTCFTFAGGKLISALEECEKKWDKESLTTIDGKM